MKRKITAKLYEWKNMKKGRMPLLIYGARQVGKTFEMREFGALYYKNTVYVNFETDERIGKYFDTDIHADYIIAILEKYYQVKIVPENTLIIFDEIQMCERALTSLKYFSASLYSFNLKFNNPKLYIDSIHFLLLDFSYQYLASSYSL